MAAAITGITPAKGSPFGGQVITITGTGFGTSGSVTVEGRAATIGTWSATSVTATVPPRNSGDGVILGGGTVSVVLTAQDASTASTSYEYAATQIERAIQSMAARIGQCTVQNGYNHTIALAQVKAMKEDQTADTGAGWPQVVLFVDSVETITDEPFDHTKDTVNIIVQGVKPCDNPLTWNIEAMALMSDLRRAIMRDRSNSGTCNTTTVLAAEIGKSTDYAAGSLSAVSMTVQIEVPSIINDMTTNTVFDSTLP